MQISSLCVYCGAAGAVAERYKTVARDLGTMLARRNITLIYGGGRIGLMNEVAEGCRQTGGRVVGIIPDFLDRWEIGHRDIAELRIVGSMHARKQEMFDLSDAFIVLPGGFGTLDETMEILTWRILRQHDKPIIIVNTDGYWDRLLALVDQVIDEKFAAATVREMFHVVPTPQAALDWLETLPQPTMRGDSARL